jgi:hypothetical protein
MKVGTLAPSVIRLANGHNWPTRGLRQVHFQKQPVIFR